MHAKFLAEHERREREGGAKPVMAARLNDKTIVTVGGKLHYSTTWRTFADFLIDYVVEEVGVDWFEADWGRPPEQRHPLSKLRAAFYEFSAAQPVANGMIECAPSGPAYEYLLVSYELYLLAHHMKLQKLVIHRLKDPNLYQGARYELFVAATCIKVGLLIEMEDEEEGLIKRPEFIATHPQTSTSFAVEAKRRHRDVKVERAEARPPKADMGSLLGNAFRKKPALPYLVFADVNLPPIDALDAANPENVARQVEETLKRLARNEEDGKDPFSVVVLTNRPDLYVDVHTPAPAAWAYFIAAENPRHGFLPLAVIEALRRAVISQRELPADVHDPVVARA